MIAIKRADTRKRATLGATSTLASLTAVLGLGLAACASSVDGASTASERTGHSEGALTRPRRISVARPVAAVSGGSGASRASGSSLVNYNGGRVLANVNVVAVFWGAVDATVEGNIGGFYRAVTQSSYMDWLSEYSTPNQVIGRGSLSAESSFTPKNQSTNLSDSDIQTELAAQINAQMLPPPDDNTLYMVHFPPGVVISAFGETSCQIGGFCAYHGSFSYNGQDVAYGVLPDFGPGSGCDTLCGGSTQFNNTTSTASHEMIEAVTDPDFQSAWWSSASDEIGDICNQQQAPLPGTSYTVQKGWSNQAGACIAHDILFGAPQKWSSSFCQTGEDCRVADVDGDGYADAVAFNHGLNGANAVFVGLSNGSGFGAPQRWSSFFCQAGEVCGTGHFHASQDRKTDIVAFNHGQSGQNGAWVSLSNGGGFDAPQEWSGFFCEGGEVCKVADVNHDGMDDVIAFNHGLNGQNAVWVALSTGAGFTAPQQWSSYFCLGSETCDVGDVNGDHNADIIAFTGDPNDAAWVALSTSAGFAAPQQWSPLFCRTGEVCKTADFNGDGRADVVAFNHGLGGNNLAWASLSTGTSFAPPHEASTFFCTASQTCAVGDVSGDGVADAVAFTQGSAMQAWVGLGVP